MTLNDVRLAVAEIKNTKSEVANLIDHTTINNNKRIKRSLLPFGHLLSFLFGAADQDDLNEIKADVKRLCENQMDQTNILNEILTITNISRGLINENRTKVNIIRDTLLGINETIISIEAHIKDLFSAKIFFLLNSESMIHHTRLRMLLKQMQHDIILIR